ncbi:MAG: glycosyltransferase family 4 protein, partial [bacterium]|nr:glycosyltransferase family 4 protein [bacterium]
MQRPAKLVKHLPEFGWTIEVLTAAHDRFPWLDESLLKEVPSDCRVHRVAGHEPACLAEAIASVLECATGTDSLRSVRIGIEDGLWWRLTRLLERLGVDDAQSLWVRPAIQAAVRRHRRYPVDVVISTGPPHFAHQVGMGVARASGLPWVADVRDPLVSDFNRRAAGRRQLSAMRRLERLIVRHADVVVTTCPSLADDLEAALAAAPEEAPA